MSRKSKGFIKLEWECPNCGTRNPGPQKTCARCGAPQPDNVQFDMGANREFVKDEAEVKQAAAGADIYCAYCNTRNRADAKVCSQCGAELTEGKQRTAGREMKPTPVAQPLTCDNCGHENAAGAGQCAKCGAPLQRASAPSPAAPVYTEAARPTPAAAAKKPANKWLIGGVVAFLLMCCAAAVVMFALPTQTVTGTVTDIRWETSVEVERQEKVHYSDQSSAPSDAYNVDCHTETDQVCTEKTIDQGNGYAEVVQECRDERRESCSYDRMEWKTARTETESGADYDPFFSQPSLKSGERLGKQNTTYTVTFDTEKGVETYKPDSLGEFQTFIIGTTWELKMNLVGGVLDAQPAK